MMKKQLTSLVSLCTLCLVYAGALHGQESNSTDPTSELLNYQNWSVQCVRSEENVRSCQQFQRVFLENGQQLMMITIQKNVSLPDQDEPAQVVLVAVPLGVHLPSGIRLQIDEKEPIGVQYERCDQGGCFAGLKLEKEVISDLKRGNEAKITFNDLAGQSITATVSLNGFSAAYNSF